MQDLHQRDGDCVLVPLARPHQVTNHAPHLKMVWDWIDVPDTDFFVWSHQNVYIKYFNLQANQPEDYVNIVLSMELEIQCIVEACSACPRL
jgi:hypothetical protein